MKKEVKVVLSTIGILLAMGSFFENPSTDTLWSCGWAIIFLVVYIYFQTRSISNWLKILKGLIVD